MCPQLCSDFKTNASCTRHQQCVWVGGSCANAPPPPPLRCRSPLPPEYVCKTCRRPTFSWHTLPVFLHVSAEDVLRFDARALSTITKFPIVTIEKWQGCKSPDYTTEEAAMLAAAQSIKSAAAAAGKNVSVIVWFDSFRIYPTNVRHDNFDTVLGHRLLVEQLHVSHPPTHPAARHATCLYMVPVRVGC